MLTVILSYSDESTCIQRWVDLINNVCAQTDDIHFIIVDDASVDAPAIAYMDKLHFPDNVSLYRMRYMIKYNMYGCRNLAMQETKTDWNLLCNITSIFEAQDILAIKTSINSGTLDSNNVYDFANSPIEKNIFLLTKDVFWKSGAYDPEWVGCRGGQVTTIERILSTHAKETLPFSVTRIAPVSIDREDDRIDTMYSLPIFDNEKAKQTVRATIQQRRKSTNPTPTQNVEWSQQL